MHRYNNQDHSMYTAMLAVEEEYHEEAGADRSDAGRGSGRSAPVLPSR